jgi:hypothetical protein
MIEFIPDRRLLVGREWAADLAEHLGWGGGACPPVGVGHQVRQTLALVRMSDRAAQAAPQPLDPVGIGVVGRGCRPAPAARPAPPAARAAAVTPWGVDVKVVQDHHGDLAAGLGTCHGAAQLGAQWGGAAAVGHRPVQVAASPVDQPDAVFFAVGARGLDQPPARAATAEHTRVRVGCRATSTSSCRYRSARASSPSRRGRSSGNSSSARVASGTSSHAGGGTGDAAAARSASTLRRFAHPGWLCALRESVQTGRLHTYPAR